MCVCVCVCKCRGISTGTLPSMSLRERDLSGQALSGTRACCTDSALLLKGDLDTDSRHLNERLEKPQYKKKRKTSKRTRQMGKEAKVSESIQAVLDHLLSGMLPR